MTDIVLPALIFAAALGVGLVAFVIGFGIVAFVNLMQQRRTIRRRLRAVRF